MVGKHILPGDIVVLDGDFRPLGVTLTRATLWPLSSSLNGNPVSPNTGQLFTVGALGFNTSDLVGFDVSGLSGVAYASLTASAGNASQLFTIDLNSGAATLVGTIGGGVPLSGLAALPGSAAAPDAGSSLLLLGLGVAAVAGLRRAFWC
jgi:hypothetical protein